MQEKLAQNGAARRREAGLARDHQKAVLAELRRRGTSVTRWAEAHGYRWRTVYSVIEVWVGRTDREPHGGIARQVLTDLRSDLGADLVPLPSAEIKDAA